MKRLLTFSLLLVAFALMASVSWAATDHAMSFALNISGPASAAHSDILDTGAGSWTRVVDYSGSATLSASSAPAPLASFTMSKLECSKQAFRLEYFSMG